MDWTKPIYFKGEVLSVEVNRARGFTEKQLNRLLWVIERMLVVYNSLEFKIAVTTGEPFKDTNGMTRAEVYDRIMSGQDLYGSADGDLDIDITLYYRRFTKVVGYTYPGTMRTWFNRKFWKDDAFVAGNICHEGCHGAGFGEEVAYLYGDTMTRMMRQLLKGKQFHSVKKDILARAETPPIIKNLSSSTLTPPSPSPSADDETDSI